jgi:hypothetical protein
VVFIYTVSGLVRDGRSNGGGRGQVLGGSEWLGGSGVGGIKGAVWWLSGYCVFRLYRFSFTVSESELRLLSLMLCRRGFHALLRCKPSSVLMLLGCNWISIELSVWECADVSDHCMALRERAAGDSNLFVVEKRLRRLQKKHEKQSARQCEREKQETNVFDFINSKLGGKRGLQHVHSCVGVNCNVAFVVCGGRVWPDCSATDTLQYSGGHHLGRRFKWHYSF